MKDNRRFMPIGWVGLMKTLRWLIVFVAAAIVAYLLLSTSAARAGRNTQIVMDPATAE